LWPSCAKKVEKSKGLSSQKGPVLNVRWLKIVEKFMIFIDFNSLASRSSSHYHCWSQCPALTLPVRLSSWKYLPTPALPDGSHNFYKDCCYFNVSSSMILVVEDDTVYFYDGNGK
jgi:Transport protein Avl9